MYFMRKLCVMLLLVFCWIGCGSVNAEGITPFYRDIASSKASLTVTNKVATCTSAIKAKDADNIIEVTMILRKESSGSWVDIKKWTGTGKKNVRISRNFSLSSSGKYRVIARGTVKDPQGKVLEKISVNSSIVTV